VFQLGTTRSRAAHRLHQGLSFSWLLRLHPFSKLIASHGVHIDEVGSGSSILVHDGRPQLESYPSRCATYRLSPRRGQKTAVLMSARRSCFQPSQTQRPQGILETYPPAPSTLRIHHSACTRSSLRA